MATQKAPQVFERITKIVKGKPTTSLKEVKTDGTASGLDKAIDALKKNRVLYFEVVNPSEGIKKQYKRTLSGRNYETKIIKNQ